MEPAPTSDRRLDLAVRASLAWYEDVFRVHRIPTRYERGLWSALGEPPRWHSAAKTVHRDVPAERVLGGRGLRELFRRRLVRNLGPRGPRVPPFVRATWLFRAAPVSPTPLWPDGWSVVSDDDELTAWNTAQDTTGVLVADLLRHPRFTFLVRRESERLVAGAVLHRADGAVELSNTWTRGDEADEIHSMLRCAEVLYPDAPVVGYSRNETLRAYTGAGFSALGPQVVWVREQ